MKTPLSTQAWKTALCVVAGGIMIAANTALAAEEAKQVEKTILNLGAFGRRILRPATLFRRFKSLQYLRPPFVYRNGWMSRRALPR